MRLPASRGPVTALLVETLRRPPHDFAAPLCRRLPDRPGAAALADEDLQLALFICYELHHQGFAEVAHGWEWQPGLLEFRAAAERRFLAALRAAVAESALASAAAALAAATGADPPEATSSYGQPGPQDVPAELARMIRADRGPRLAAYLRRRAGADQFREFVAHRSLFHVREADLHTWGIPLLRGRPYDLHADLFATTMRSLGLDPGYGAYLDLVPAPTLAIGNLRSLFGLHRGLRGALLGHLAALELTCARTNRRYGQGLRRLGGDAAATRFYDEYGRAGPVPEPGTAQDLCGSFVADHPGAAADVLFGAACCLELERRFGERLLDCWQQGRGSLRRPLGPAVSVPAGPGAAVPAGPVVWA